MLQPSMEVPALHSHSSQTHKISFPPEQDNSWVVPEPRKHENGLRKVIDHESAIRILIADRDSMSSDLLATALTRARDFRASAVRSTDLLDCMADGKASLVVIGADLTLDTRNGFDLAHTVHRAHPSVPIVILLNHSTHDSVVNAFRSGARGVFCRQQPVAEFLDCVEHVGKGFIWAGSQETTLLLDAFSSFPSPDVAIGGKTASLSLRELQVVKGAARGKINKVIASDLGLSEHTVKNYLFRAFEKLGVSNRVELLFYLNLRDHTFGAIQSEDSETDLKTD
jgi:DNA-binding NarL/FixJ family response regulator